MLAAAIGAVAYTTSSAKISAPLRTKVLRAAIRDSSKGKRWFADLLSCPYCVSHWLAFAATLIYRPWLVDANLSADVAPSWVGRVFDFLVTSMAMVTMAMVAVWLIKRALAPVSAPAAGQEGGQPGAADRVNRSAPSRAQPHPDDPATWRVRNQPGHIAPRGSTPTDTQVVGRTSSQVDQPPPTARPRHVRPDATMVDGMPPVQDQQPGSDPAAETQVLGATPPIPTKPE
jgi:hypothetical protein